MNPDEATAGASTYRFESPGPAWVVPFLTGVGRRLAHAPLGTGLLVEQRVGATDVRLVVAEPFVAQLLEESAAEVAGRVRRLPIEPWGEPPNRAEVVAVVVRPADPLQVAPTLTDRAGGHRPPAPPPLGLPSPENPSVLNLPIPGTWAATQSHWISIGHGELFVWLRAAVGGAPALTPSAVDHFRTMLSRHVERATSVRADVRITPWSRRVAREWNAGALRRFRGRAPFGLLPEAAARASTHLPAPGHRLEPSLVQQTVVIGASGSGKTAFLATVARRWVEAGRPAVVLDVHGDLTPSILTAANPSARARVLAIDAGGSADRIPGLSLLSAAGGPAAEREAATLVAALKRLSGEGGELHWGFRLERILDVFVRLAQEEGGSLRELHALLTDPRRREAARLTTRRPDAARLLEELPAILRRNPEFLWSAAVRVSKVALVPAVAALVAPPGESLPLEELLDAGRSVFWRLPIGQLGPEAAGFIANLLVSRLFFSAASRGRLGSADRSVLLVVDEAQLLAPHLLVDVIAEGRKFGVAVLLATQYPERFSPDLRAAAAGAAGTHVVFRVAPAASRTAGSWVGLSPEDAARWLPALPAGHALFSTAGAALGPELIASEALVPGDERLWASRLRATVDEFPDTLSRTADTSETIVLEQAVLFAVMGLELRGVHPNTGQVVEEVAVHSLPNLDPAAAAEEVHRLVGRGWLVESAGTFSVSTAGARYLGMSPETQAPSESGEHRSLLLEAFRIFARHGERLEILLQGRFDTRLPDARLRLLPPSLGRRTPVEVAAFVRQRGRTWAWRLSGGRDIHVEAEVSGATRPARIRRGLDKARDGRAMVVFAVADAARAHRLRGILAHAGAARRDAQVWTLPRAALPRPVPASRPPVLLT